MKADSFLFIVIKEFLFPSMAHEMRQSVHLKASFPYNDRSLRFSICPVVDLDLLHGGAAPALSVPFLIYQWHLSYFTEAYLGF